MASHASVVDSDGSSDSHPSILIVDPEASSSSSSSSSSGPKASRDWAVKYCKLPKKRPVALRFMTWAAGRPRKACYMKKKYRKENTDSELFRVSTSTLISSMLGRWPKETRMYWVTLLDDNEGREKGKKDEKASTGKDSSKDNGSKPRIFMMSGAGGKGGPARMPVYVHPSGAGMPTPMPPMDPRYSGPMPRYPPGMAGQRSEI